MLGPSVQAEGRGRGGSQWERGQGHPPGDHDHRAGSKELGLSELSQWKVMRAFRLIGAVL